MKRIELVAGLLGAALLSFGTAGFALGFFSRDDPPDASPLCRVVIEYPANDPQQVQVFATGNANPIARCSAKGDRIAVGAVALQFLSGD